MKPYGKGRRQVLLLGEAPGQTEDDEGRPFIGKAGQFLRDCLEGIGVDMDKDCLTTNALICHPEGNATPSEDQIRYCRANLTATVAAFQPRVIVTLGRSALNSALLGKWHDFKALERWVGWRIPLAQHWICPTYHPSYLLRMKNPMLEKFFQKHLEAAFEIERDTPAIPDFKPLIEILLDETLILQGIEDMIKSEWVAVDYEANCLKPEWPKARLVSCALCNGKRTISFPWTPAAKEAMEILLLGSDCRKIASNLKMEERWTKKEFGRGVFNWGWDTMLAAHCLDNRTGICSLKFQSLVKLGVPTYNDHIEPFLTSKGHYNRIDEIAVRELLFYGGMDALLEYQLARKQRKELGYD